MAGPDRQIKQVVRTDETSQSFAAAAICFAVTVQRAATRSMGAMLGSGNGRRILWEKRAEIAGGRRPSLPGGIAMEFVWSVVTFIGQVVEAIFGYVEHHHWIFAFLAGGYVFYLHDRSIHARFDALDKRVDEVRKRLAIEY
ncbi:hypothetical protein NLM23_09035 [Bradyrhizobium cajani]|nr:hypothetical protein [Bradyrhizobium cajani]MCP3369202.1 hypothetical protein [Bradyrhizobium cajani]